MMMLRRLRALLLTDPLRPPLLTHHFFPLAKKLYEGLGVGRPTPLTVPSHPPA